jgi:hypothetical protein
MMTIGIALGAMLFFPVGDADACRFAMEGRAAPPPALAPPVLVEAGYEPPRFDDGEWRPGTLWLRLADAEAPAYMVERVGGDEPLALSPLWYQPAAPQGGLLRLPLDGDVGVPPFGVAVRVRPLDHRIGPPSNALWVSNPHGSSAPRGDDSQRTLFALLAGVLALLAIGFRRARDPETRVRFAVVGALTGAVILLATSGMPWMQSAEAGVECLLGDESLCAAPPLAELAVRDAGLALFELERWQAGAAAVRMGQLLAFALLLPALIWLLVEPRARPAQATAAVGASVAAFAFLAVAFYRTTMPSWLIADLYVTFDLAMLAAGAIVLAAVAIVRQAFALGAPPEPPRAVARRL